MPKFIRCDVLPVDRRKQPIRDAKSAWGYGVYSKHLLADGFSVATKVLAVFRRKADADQYAAAAAAHA